MTAWLRDNLPQPTRLLNTGCSAGGAGSTLNHFFIRESLEPEEAYLFGDSGPIFPANAAEGTGASLPLHLTVRDAWGLDQIIETLKAENPVFASLDSNDLSSVYRALSEALPEDRMAISHFIRDFNFSLYSYERFYDEIVNPFSDPVSAQIVHDFFLEDTLKLAALLDEFDNFAYFIPYFRSLNSSHCTAIVNYDDTDIAEDGRDVSQFMDDLVNSRRPLVSAIELDGTDDLSQPPNVIFDLVNRGQFDDLGAFLETVDLSEVDVFVEVDLRF